MFFKKKPLPSIRTNGYYHFRQKTKSEQGEPLQIDYSLIFRDIQPNDDEYSHFVYLNFQFDQTQLNTTLIRAAFYRIQQSSDSPESFDQLLCKTDKQFIKFIDDRIIESQHMGQKNVFEGMFFENSLILNYFVFGFDYNGNSATATYFSDSTFKFYELA